MEKKEVMMAWMNDGWWGTSLILYLEKEQDGS
jgi:hypothetical protein